MASLSNFSKDELIKLVRELEEENVIKTKQYDKLWDEHNELIAEQKKKEQKHCQELENNEKVIKQLLIKNKELSKSIYKGIKEICKGYTYEPNKDETWNELNFEKNGGLVYAINKMSWDTGEDVLTVSFDD